MGSHQRERFGAITGFEKSMLLVAQKCHQEFSIEGVVVDGKNRRHSQSSSVRAKQSKQSSTSFSNCCGSMGRNRNFAAPSASPCSRSRSVVAVEVMKMKGIEDNRWSFLISWMKS